MGSKASSAPPPDPRLVDAQLKSMGIQDNAIEAIMAQSAAMQPLQREQMQFGLDAARTAYQQSQDDRGWTLGKRQQLDAAQRPMIDEAANYNEDDRRAEMSGLANADISQLFSAARDSGMRGMGRMGVNASDGRMAAFSHQGSMQEALAKSMAGRKVSEAARAEGMQLRGNAANMLSGYPSMGMQATGAGAGYGASGLGLANQGLAGMNSGYGQAGQVAGQMGSNATNMWVAQANYKLGADKQAADNDPFAALLGAGAQLGAAAIFKSDRRLKCDIVPVGQDASTGLTLYHFTYRDLPGRRWEGVMADEVFRVMPEAVRYGADGFAQVNYDLLGIEMKQVEVLQ